MNQVFKFFFCLSVLMVGADMMAQKTTTEPTEGRLDVFIPNAFTPNFDGLNDVWRPVVNGPEIENYELIVLDRTGSEVFRSTDPKEVWNGSVKGDNYTSSPSLFVYFLKVKSVASIETQTFRGHIVLLR